jgi:hypothetical protein
MSVIKLADRFSINTSSKIKSKNVSDKLNVKKFKKLRKKHDPTLWAYTQIMGGYDLYRDNNGISHLGEVVFETENMVPIGGVQYAMEQIFGIKGSLAIPTLNDTLQIGAIGSTITASNGMPYPYGQRVCLFGVGTGGAAENNISALDVKYNETGLADMVPFRYSSEYLSSTDQDKYYGKKTVNGITAYYLKAFDQEPEEYNLYKNGENGEDGTKVDSNYFSAYSEIGVQSFTECNLSISKKDLREWFEANDDIELCRVNTIGLFTAVYDAAKGDYANIKLFSKLNIPTESFSSAKEMNIIYRVFGA